MASNCTLEWNGDCSIEYQWALADQGCIKADPDVVGIGVLATIVISALTTLFAIHIGYMTYSIPAGLINHADHVFIRAWQLPWRLFRRETEPSISSGSNPTDEAIEKRKERIKSMQTFLLALSDQQLVTGIALLIAAFVRWRDITIYSISVGTSLTLLSSTVHLATIPTLRSNLRTHRPLKLLRAFTMAALFVMIMVLVFPPMGTNWWPAHKVSDIYFKCGLHQWHTTWPLPRVGTQVGVAIYFIITYQEALACFFTKDECNWPSGQGFYILFCERRTLDLLRRQQDDDYTQLFPPAPHRVPTHLWNLRYAESYAFFEYCQSSAYNMNWLLFGQVYSMTYVFVWRNQSEVTVGPFNDFGYGQIVPFAMLLLPIFAALEAIYDYKVEKARIENAENNNSATNTAGDNSSTNHPNPAHTQPSPAPAGNDTPMQDLPPATTPRDPQSPTPLPRASTERSVGMPPPSPPKPLTHSTSTTVKFFLFLYASCNFAFSITLGVLAALLKPSLYLGLWTLLVLLVIVQGRLFAGMVGRIRKASVLRKKEEMNAVGGGGKGKDAGGVAARTGATNGSTNRPTNGT